jgi:Fe-S-cluster-containing hydrogenase component 2
MDKQLMINPEKCVGCKTCELVCSYNREKNFFPVNSAVSVNVFKEALICVPVMCMQCETASCVNICPVGAMYRDDNGVIRCDAEACIGCKLCVNACPLGNAVFSPKARKIIKCELCGGNPLCAKYCPVEAIVFTDSADGLGRKKALAAALKEVYGADSKTAAAV